MSLTGRLRDWVPRWWRGEGGAVGSVLDVALAPAELGYRTVVRARELGYRTGVFRVRSALVPVISVGNLAVGGAGKTPMSAWVARKLLDWDHRPAIVLRGYGADEIMVHQELNPRIPVFASARRILGVEQASAEGRDVVVLDDGFQHRSLHRDLDIVLLAAESWGGRRKLLPRGPWRESHHTLERAGAVVVTRKSASSKEAAAVADAVGRLVPGAKISIAHLAADSLRPLGGGEVVLLRELGSIDLLAVASLADPRPFHRQLRSAGANVELATFPDHHDFTQDEADSLVRRAGDRSLVMTLKEAVKLRALLPPDVGALVLEQRVEIETGAAALEKALRTAVLS